MLEIKASGLERAMKRFQQMKDKAKNPRHVMDTIGAKAWRDVLNSFNVETDKDGKPWKKWIDPKTGKRVGSRPTKRGGTKLLQDRGRLRASIRWAASTTEARVFTKVSYAKAHEYGTGKMVARSFMWISDKLHLKLLKDLLDYIKG